MVESPERPPRRESNIQVELGGEAVQLASRPGYADWNRVSDAARLIARHAEIAPGERVLVCPCGNGALGVWAARRAGAQGVTMLDTHIVAVEDARRAAWANGCGAVRVEAALPTPDMGPFDAALMTLPKGRDLARLYFLACGRALRAGGRFYLAGPNDGGIKSALKDAEALYGPGALLAYKGGNRVTVFTRPPDLGGELPEMYRTPGVAEGTHHEFEVAINDERLTIHSRPGVFSWREFDAGTRALLENLPVLSTDRVLDVGCGYGVVGLYAARRALKGEVTMVDADALAIACARETAAANGLEERVELLLGDGLQAVAGRRFTLIASNPPFHTGHAVNSEVAESFVRGAFDALEPRGRLVIVANRFLPYDRLMTELFGAVEALAQTPQYHVLCAEKVRERRARGKLTKAQRQQAELDEWMAQAKGLE